MKTLGLFCCWVGLVVTAAGAAPDRPVRVVPSIDPVFPQDPIAEDYPWGQATAVIEVNADGELVDLLVQRATNDSFARAAERALRLWSYEPAVKDGRTVGSRHVVTLHFEPRGVAISMSRGAFLTRRLDMVTGVRAGRDRVAKAGQLDEPLQLLEAVSPRTPPMEKEQATVLLDFFIDEQGRPRMPVVLQAESDLHALAAVEALEKWRFTPPTRAGQPVIVHAKQEFHFARPPAEDGA